MFYKFSFVVIACLLFFSGAQADTFEIGENDFLLNKKPVVIKSGELHFNRIPREYWSHRLRMCRAMGLNAVCAYMFWNVHEPESGQFDFSGQNDVVEFCRLAQKEGLMVLLRPGPYSCAEWDFGGFPYWLLKDPKMKLRTRYPAFLKASRRYILEVGKRLTPMQITQGGPIVMLQVENEYGAYGTDKEYLGKIRDYWKEAGFSIPLFGCDPYPSLRHAFRDDLFMVVNFGDNPDQAFRLLRNFQKTGPLMCGEFYPAWFDHWGKPHQTKAASIIIPPIKTMLDMNASFSLYMVHGGTSFGFTVGANYTSRYDPQITSYDYDAPISEAGWATHKFMEMRKLLSQYLASEERLPEIPPAPPVITIPEMTFTQTAKLMENLTTPIKSEHPQSFESLGQNQGCAVYQTEIPAGEAGIIRFTAVNDFAQVYLDGKKVAIVNRASKPGKWLAAWGDGRHFVKSTNHDYSIEVAVPARKVKAELKILIEGMGHINVGPIMNFDRKGIYGPVRLEVNGKKTELEDWKTFLLPLDAAHLSRCSFKEEKTGEPAFYQTEFTLDKIGDTFLDMSKWGKGVVWVNGHNLGRYWRIGPQQTLYLPGPWLKKGKNEIVVLELLGAEKTAIKGLAKPILNSVRK
ncbi:MAG TPA: beta-galactosidase [Phycisphaerales bacterium]|nr:beta-galactosidase [Phycisphaerales bacterium]